MGNATQRVFFPDASITPTRNLAMLPPTLANLVSLTPGYDGSPGISADLSFTPDSSVCTKAIFFHQDSKLIARLKQNR